MGPKGLLDTSSTEIRVSPQRGIDTGPSYYSSGFPQKMREAYVKQWHAEHDPPIGQEPYHRPTPSIRAGTGTTCAPISGIFSKP